MKIIIGLGNPGEKYEKSRHNAGFIVIEQIKNKLDFPDFKIEKKFEAEISEGNFNNEKIILAKPQTFMNLSGQAIKKIADFYKTPTNDIIIIQDDLDINIGCFKISTSSSSAGHNGIQSIFDIFKTQQIKRVRIGIEGAEKKLERKIAGKDFVLENFSDEELENIKEISTKIKDDIF